MSYKIYQTFIKCIRALKSSFGGKSDILTLMVNKKVFHPLHK